MYCGNNKYDKDLLSGKKILGNQYDCFKKGINIGKHLTIDNPAENYSPIFTNNIYCGKNLNNENLGNLPQCLQKGVGVGIGLQIKEKKDKSKDGSIDIMYYVFIALGLILILFLILFIFKIFKKNRKDVN